MTSPQIVPRRRRFGPQGGMDPWPLVTAFASRHYGVVDRAALDRADVTTKQVGRWVRSGRLVRCAPRVWRVVGTPVTWEQHLMAGLLTLGKRAVVSHRAAAALHTLEHAPAGIVEFTVPRDERHARFAATVHSTTTLRPPDIVTVRGFRATSATRTLIDIAGSGCRRDDLAAMLDSAVHLQLSAPAVIRRRLTALGRRGRAGVQLLDTVLVDAGGHSVLERKFLHLVRVAGLPRPRTQVVFTHDRRTVARVDFLFPEHDLVVEVSGRLGHSSPTERARDAQRRNELQDIGLAVYEFTWEQVTRTPDRVVQALRDRLVDSRPA